jgi:hypothetical protein
MPDVFNWLGIDRIDRFVSMSDMKHDALTDHGIEVGTGKGRLVITHLQPEGKKRMSASSFLAGHKMIKGNVFDGHPELSTPTRGTHA